MALLCLPALPTTALAVRTINGEETWSGTIKVEENVVVPAGASLSIRPGTQVLFAENTALAVEGRLTAKGTSKKPITLRAVSKSKPASWQGISLQNASDPAVLEFVRIEGAAQALSVVGSKVRMASSLVEKGTKGVLLAIESDAEFDDVTFRDLSDGGIEASVRGHALVRGCRFEAIPGFGVQVEKQASILVRDSQLIDVKLGLLVSGEFAPLEGNHIEGSELAIGITQGSPNSVVAGNTIIHSKVGVGCRQFASPLIRNNDIRDCEVAIDCYQGSSPQIDHNRLSHNQRAIQCVQMSNPVITMNELTNNDAAIYLHLSSYAQISDNNFDANRLHVELDNMSYDWEVRALHKPKRNLQAKNEVLVKQGRAMPEKVTVSVESKGFVDARQNYWGVKTTAELAAKGDNANITSLHDGFDEPTRSYEGWPGEYKIDKIRFSDWRSAPVSGAGPTPTAAQ